MKIEEAIKICEEMSDEHSKDLLNCWDIEESKEAIKIILRNLDALADMNISADKQLKQQNKEIQILRDRTINYEKTLEKLQKDTIFKSKIKEKIKEIKGYSKIAKEQIENRIIIADSDSLNYGRNEAHNADIYLLNELLEEDKQCQN